MKQITRYLVVGPVSHRGFSQPLRGDGNHLLEIATKNDSGLDAVLLPYPFTDCGIERNEPRDGKELGVALSPAVSIFTPAVAVESRASSMREGLY